MTKNKFTSQLINKKFKQKHTGVGGSYPSRGCISNYRAPRHQWRSTGDRMKPYTNGCYCCSRSPKYKFIARLEEKKSIKKDLVKLK
jgi:hypothetical protein